MSKLHLLCVALVAATLLSGWGDQHDDAPWPHSGPMPDNPVKVKPQIYRPIGEGNKSYRPVSPLPWDDVNKRVMPGSAGQGAGPTAVPGTGGSASPAPAAPAPAMPGAATPKPLQFPAASPSGPGVPVMEPQAPPVAPPSVPPAPVLPSLTPVTP
jgi:hypothetical protein